MRTHLRLARDLAMLCGATLVAFCLIHAAALAHWTGPSDPGLHAWSDSLSSGRGMCCSFADGLSIDDVDWDTGGPGNTYRVRLNGKWIDVPAVAVVTAPNKYGRAVVWPYEDADGVIQIRCFMPGPGA